MLVPTTDPGAEKLPGGVILFDHGSDEVSETVKKNLDVLFAFLRGSQFRIRITGHASTDEAGPYRDVDDLAYTRAWNTREYFVSQGLPRAVFALVVAGASDPLDPSDYPDVGPPNRRNEYVEIVKTATLIDAFDGDK